MKTQVDGKACWILVAAAFFVYLVAVGMQYTTGIFYKAWVKSTAFSAISPSKLAFATSIEGAMFLLSSAIAGKLIVRWGEIFTTYVGAACILSGAVITAVVEVSGPSAVGMLYAFFGIIMGSGCAIVHVAAVVKVQSYFKKRRGLATGITVAGSGCGAFVLGPLLEWIVNASGWRTALAVYGAVGSAICIIAAWCMGTVVLDTDTSSVASEPPTPVGASETPHKTVSDLDLSEMSLASSDHTQEGFTGDIADPSKATSRIARVIGVSSASAPAEPAIGEEMAVSKGAAVGSRPPPQNKYAYRDLPKYRFFTSYSSFIVFFAICWFTAPTYFPITIIDRLGGTSADVSGAVAVQGVANTLGRVVMGIATDMFPKRKLFILSACMAIVTAGSLAFTLSNSLAFAYVYGGILGGFGGSIVSIQPALIIDFLGIPALPLFQGAINGLQAPFALVGPPIGGAIKAATGSYEGTWAFVTACFGTAFFVSTFIGDTNPWTARRERPLLGITQP